MDTSMTERPSGAASEGPELAAVLRAIDERTRALADLASVLRPLVALAEQAPAMMAMLGDSFDDVMRTAMEHGIDVERGIVNGTEAALRFGASMDAERVREMDALLQSGLLDPATLRVMGELGRSLTETASAPVPSMGMLALLRALADADVQRAVGFLVTFAERFGSRLGKAQPSRR